MERFRLGSLGQESGSSSKSFNDSSPFDSEQIDLLVRATPGRMVSLGTCAKVGVISFTLGVFVGFTLKRRVRRWVTKILKRMKDD